MRSDSAAGRKEHLLKFVTPVCQRLPLTWSRDPKLSTVDVRCPTTVSSTPLTRATATLSYPRVHQGIPALSTCLKLVSKCRQCSGSFDGSLWSCGVHSLWTFGQLFFSFFFLVSSPGVHSWFFTRLIIHASQQIILLCIVQEVETGLASRMFQSDHCA